MAQGSGKYYVDTYSGNVFVGTTAVAGVNLPAFNATAHTFCVWNPAGSGKNIIPIKCSVGYSATTGAAGNFVYAFQSGVGAQVATGGPITAGTFVAPINGLVGFGNASIAKFAPATITFASATLLLRTMGVSQLVTTAATTSATTFAATEDFDGTLIVPPGTALCVAGNIALLSAFDVTMVWEEFPV